MSQEKNIGDPEKDMDKREFELYLQGKSALSQQYADLSDVQLPDHLDAAIMAEAHRAVGARPGSVKKRKWTIPLSMVATLFVVVMAGLILPYMLKDMQRQQEYAAVPESIPASAAPAPVTTAVPVSPLEQPVPAAKKEAPAVELEAKVLQKNIAELRERDSKMIQAEPAKPRQLGSGLLADSEAPASTVEMFGMIKPAAKESASGMASQKSEIVSSQAESAKRRIAVTPAADRLEEKEDKPAPAVALAAATAEAQITGSSRLQREAERESINSAEKRSAAAPRQFAADEISQPHAAEVVTELSVSQSKADSAKDDAGAAILLPAEWIKRLRKMKLDGKTDILKKELAAFKRRYPAYPLPRDLQSGEKE